MKFLLPALYRLFVAFVLKLANSKASKLSVHKKSEGNRPSLFYINQKQQTNQGADAEPFPLVLLSRSNIKPKRRVLDRGFRFTPFPEGAI
jgi:hypothetical protein